ncbi:MAG: DNA alkylation repair protein [Candidatus Aphodosoma sp.]
MDNKKYFAVNETLNKEILQIRNKIMLSMNGICAETMQKSGFNYGKNFGVSWNRLCEIASDYEQNYDLAIRLWNMEIRETKLIATKICPPEMLNENNINDWISEINNSELAEITAIMFAKNKNLIKTYITLLSHNNFYVRLCMLHTLSKSAYILNDTDVNNILEKIDISDTDNISATRAIESILLFLQTKGLDKQITEFTNKLKSANTAHSEYLYKTLIY